MDFEHYFPFSTIYRYLHCLKQTYPARTEIIEIGKSIEGRPLHVLKVRRLNQKGPVRSIWIDAGMHAREWITAPVALYLLYQLVERSEDQINIMTATNYDIYVLPMANPDGYDLLRIIISLITMSISYNKCNDQLCFSDTNIQGEGIACGGRTGERSQGVAVLGWISTEIGELIGVAKDPAGVLVTIRIEAQKLFQNQRPELSKTSSWETGMKIFNSF